MVKIHCYTNNKIINKYLNNDNSVNIAPNLMKILPFESSRREDSNGSIFIRFGSLVIKYVRNIYKTLKINNSVNINPIVMKQLPFESSCRDDSNGGIFIRFRSLNAEIINFEVL